MSEHIQVIERDKEENDQQKAALFMKWLSVHPEASWQDVLFALEKSQEYSLASRVYKKINTTLSTASTISKWVGQLSSIVEFDQIFLRLHPYFDFLDCGLIVDMSEQFLNDKPVGGNHLVTELKDHKIKANILRCSSTIKKLQSHLKSIYSPHLRGLSNMPQIQIELHNPWTEASIEGLYLLIRHLLPYRSKAHLAMISQDEHETIL